MYMPHRLPNCCRRSWRETANGATLRRCRRQRRRSGHSAQLRSKRSSSRRQWLDATSSISQYYFHIQCIHYTVVELWGGPRGPGPPERPGGPFETPGLRGYRGPLKAPPPEITRQIQYMIATYQYHSKHRWWCTDVYQSCSRGRCINHAQLLLGEIKDVA